MREKLCHSEPEHIQRIAKEIGKTLEDTVSLLTKALDWDFGGEYVYGADNQGVYLCDISNACGDYTMWPIPYAKFYELCLRRLNKQKGTMRECKTYIPA